MTEHQRKEPSPGVPEAAGDRASFDYGSGWYRRAVKLRNLGGTETVGELHDNFHAMRCRIEHDGRTVAAVHPDFLRVPLDTCGGASEPVREIVGTPLDMSVRAFFGEGRASRHCTHMLDLAWWTMQHARRLGVFERTYDVAIPDQAGGASLTVSLSRDGAPLLRWEIVDGVIVSPPPFGGRAVLKGLIGWASEHLDTALVEAALVMQKAFLVSRARRHPRLTGPAMAVADVMRGACFSYTSPRIEAAVAQQSERDMNDEASLRAFG